MDDIIAIKGPIPESILPYPESFFDQAKWLFWRFISPGFMAGQGLLIHLHILRHVGRQPYVLGRLAKGKTIMEFLKYIEAQGYANHFIAWMDDGQVLSLRKLDGFDRQYHLRVFEDGEFRGHYEFTPESHPIWHLKEVGMENRPEVFFNALQGWIEET